MFQRTALFAVIAGIGIIAFVPSAAAFDNRQFFRVGAGPSTKSRVQHPQVNAGIRNTSTISSVGLQKPGYRP
jgi:hypothetical protein